MKVPMTDPMRESIAALTNYFIGDATMNETLERVSVAALEAVSSAKFCGISMTVEGKLGTYIFTNPEVPEIDRAQYETGDGPCIESFRTGRRVLVRSTEEPGPYPEFRAVARSHGVGSVLSSPMHAADELVGAMNLYSGELDAFDDEDIRQAQAFASQAAFLLANTKAYWDARTLS